MQSSRRSRGQIRGDPKLTPQTNESSALAEKNGLDDPRALDILTTEHWSLLSTRALGFQEMFARTTIFIAILSGTVVTLALLAQATHFGRETLWFALLLISVDLFIGVATFVRSVEINFEDARWLTGMHLLRCAYLKIVPDVEPFLLAAHKVDAELRALGHGTHQYVSNLRNSLTTTSGTVATLNSVLAGAVASDVSGLLGRSAGSSVLIGAIVSIMSGALHVRFAARYRRRHTPNDS